MRKSFLISVGVSQVQWNKVNCNLLATAHDGDVSIWDPRVCMLTITSTGKMFLQNVLVILKLILHNFLKIIRKCPNSTTCLMIAFSIVVQIAEGISVIL